MEKIAGSRGINELNSLPAARSGVLAHGLKLELGILVLVAGRYPGVQGNSDAGGA